MGHLRRPSPGESRPSRRWRARGLRELIIEVYPEVVEVPWPRQQITGYGVGPKKMTEHFCYIAVLSKHVNLGFYGGVKLPDPDGLLEGAGKDFRHVKIRSEADVRRPAIRKFVEEAVKERQESLGVKPQ